MDKKVHKLFPTINLYQQAKSWEAFVRQEGGLLYEIKRAVSVLSLLRLSKVPFIENLLFYTLETSG